MVDPLRAGDPAAIGPYTLAGVLGEGVRGTVYLARRDGVDVAVRLMPAGSAPDPEALARFVDELSAAKEVARARTARVLDAGADGERPYVVSEYVHGVSLQDSVAQEGPCGGAVLARLAVDTLTALTAIHAAGIVHRDFRPASVLLGDDGPQVVDFGIARALNTTAHSADVGSPAYMSPEQVAGRELTFASDLFSWASSMLFAATGAPPFGTAETGDVAHRILHDEPDTGVLPQPLRDVVAACLAKDPEARPNADDARASLAGGFVTETAGQSAERSPRATRTLPGNSTAAEAAEREPYPFEIGPAPGESDALAGRGPTLVIFAFIALMMAVSVTGWALTRDSGASTTPSVTVSPVPTSDRDRGGPQVMPPDESAEGPSAKPSDDPSDDPSDKASDKPKSKPSNGATTPAP
ncbi:hypothetical protein GCM10022221_36730 [Actinocorallia aurea]